jgi:hypothetical protein
MTVRIDAFQRTVAVFTAVMFTAAIVAVVPHLPVA